MFYLLDEGMCWNIEQILHVIPVDEIRCGCFSTDFHEKHVWRVCLAVS